MSTEHSYALQQSLYGMYREYYHSGQVVLCDNSDFANGTVRIKKPGLYVLTEDILFGPKQDVEDAAGLGTGTGEYGDNAYALGFFAAVTIESDGVILDLQGHTIRQTYEHYFRQRFFNVVQLASAPFVPGQGPGPVLADGDDAPYAPARKCLILNGTIGLSSHGGVHGNNNSEVMLQNLRVRDFETTGVQLNGVHNLFMDDVDITGIACAPVTSQTFTLLRHTKALQEMIGGPSGPPSLDAPTCNGTTLPNWTAAALLTNNEATGNNTALASVVDLLREPFVAADVFAAAAATPPTVDAALDTIWRTLCTDVTDFLAEKAATTPPTEVLADPTRYVNQYTNSKTAAAATCHAPTTSTSAKPLPDGSAMYGVLVNCTGVAVGDIRGVCPANGQGCCTHAVDYAKKTSHTSRRTSESVTLHHVTVTRLHLRARETLGLKHTDLPTVAKAPFVRDFTGAVVDARTIKPGDFLERACVYVSQAKALEGSKLVDDADPVSAAIRSFVACPPSSGSIPAYDTLATACPDGVWVYNIDIMAHVSKGVFGLRLENVKGLTVEDVTVSDLVNASTLTDPRFLAAGSGLPATIPASQIVSGIAAPLDQQSAVAYGGADIRGMFIGQCHGTRVTKTTVKDCDACVGVVRAFEADEVTRCGVHTFHAKNIHGLHPTVVHLHSNSKLLHLRDVKCEDVPTNAFHTYVHTLRMALEDAATAEAAADAGTAAQEAARTQVEQAEKDLRALTRVAVNDPLMVGQELPGCVNDLRL